MAAPHRNDSAVGHGLYSQHPARRVTVLATVNENELAEHAQTMGDAAAWIAEYLDAALAEDDEAVANGTVKARRVSFANRPSAAKLVGLYASVAQEMFHLEAELAGRTGIKPSSLGKLTDQQFDRLMARQAAALSLILSQCKSAWQSLKDKEDVLGNGLIGSDGINPVLNYLASHIRSAKRIIREMAADLAWRQRGVENADDLASRILDILGEHHDESK